MFQTVGAQMPVPEWIDTGAQIATIITGLSVILVALSLFTQIKDQRLHSVFYVHEFLSQEQFSLARRHVRTTLHNKSYLEWSDEDRVAANRVCASYDQAGILILGGVINRATAKVLLRSSWGESICDQFEVLRPFLLDLQTPTKTGLEFFRHFAELYAMTCRYQKRKQVKL